MKTPKLLFAAAAAVMMSFTAPARNTIWQIASGRMLKGDGVSHLYQTYTDNAAAEYEAAGGYKGLGYYCLPGPAAKAVVADAGATLRFVYDDVDYGTKGTDWFSVAEAEKMGLYDKSPWYGCASATASTISAASRRSSAASSCSSGRATVSAI